MKRDNDNEANTELDIYINHKISIQKKTKWRNINDFQVSDSRNVRTKRKMYRVTFLN